MPIDGDGGAGPDSFSVPEPSVSCNFGPFGNQTRVYVGGEKRRLFFSF
jgi:hypothetical protein